MRFYQNSTGREGAQGHIPQSGKTTKVHSFRPVQPTQPSSAYLLYLNQYCTQFLELSNYLNQELLKNHNLIHARQAEITKPVPFINQVKKDSEDNSTASRKNPSQFNYQRIQPIAQSSSMNESRACKRKRIYDSESEESYKPQDDYSRELNGSKISESKNIPKNYGKAIITFIRKNEHFTKRVLQKVGVDEQEFMQNLKELRTRVNTIYQLRSIWIEEENRFAKAYRILSLQYLRKHSLSYIFNSRVQNFNKHIKYRYKMIKSVSDPAQFTCMKEF